MKVQLIAGAAILAGTAMFTACGLIPKTIPESKTAAFLHDTQSAYAYMLAQDEVDNYETTLDELNVNLAVQLAAAAYAERNADELTKQGDAYVIPAADLEYEVSVLFFDVDISKFEDSGCVTMDSNGDYLLTIPADFDGEDIYQVTDSFYGYVGSEPTDLTVQYTYQDQTIVVDYSVVGESSSDYTFQVTNLTIQQ